VMRAKHKKHEQDFRAAAQLYPQELELIALRHVPLANRHGAENDEGGFVAPCALRIRRGASRHDPAGMMNLNGEGERGGERGGGGGR